MPFPLCFQAFFGLKAHPDRLLQRSGRQVVPVLAQLLPVGCQGWHGCPQVDAAAGERGAGRGVVAIDGGVGDQRGSENKETN